MAGIALKYKNGSLPENLSEVLANADEQDLRILVTLMMTADAEGQVDDSLFLIDALGLEKPQIDASLKYWKGAGIIGVSRTAKRARMAAEATDKTAILTAHRNGAVEKSTGVSPYSSEELADLFERRRELSVYINEVQNVVGRILNNSEVSIVVGLVEQYDFEMEALLHIFAYAVKAGKKGIRKLEKIALEDFYDEGLTSTESVVERIVLIERSKETVYKIKHLLGVGERELTTKEKNTFNKWTQNFGYDIDVIRMAYEITVDRKNGFKLDYMNGIIERWNAEGLHTADDVLAREQAQRQEKSAHNDKSYDLDDFFEAALQRSLEDLK